MQLIELFLLFSMIAVLWFDVTRYIIPNSLVAALLVLYPVGVYLSAHAIDWKMALAGAGIVFALGYFVFAMRWMGAGDIKLLVVLALWVGWGQNLIDFIVYVTVLGGAFSVLVWGARKLEPKLPWKRNYTLPRLLREGEPVPYGVAISIGFLIVLEQGKILLLNV